MNMNEIEKSLNDMFNQTLKDEEIRRIIFWTDYDKEFTDDLEKLDLGEVKIVRLTEDNQFSIKHLLEEEDDSSSYLIYTEMDLTSENNWLYDTYMYAQTFYADRLSLMMKELEIEPSLRPIIEKHARFFASQDRTRRLKALNINPYTEEKLELGMMNVLCKTHSINLEPVLRAVLIETLDDETNTYLNEFKKYFSIETFWNYIERYYDYDRKEKTLKTLFIQLVMTSAAQAINKEHLTPYSGFISEKNQTNAYVFIDHWMNHRTDYKVYTDYILSIEKELNISDTINQLTVEHYAESEVFPYVDRAIIIYIANHLIDNQENFSTYLELIQTRRTKHFYHLYRPIYEALYYAVKMDEFKANYKHGIPKDQAINMYEAYTKEYYLMDTYYRQFYSAFDKDNQNELLQKLKTRVEYIYTDWFMGELNAHWSGAVRDEMTDDWSLQGIDPQQRFYSTHIAPHLNDNERVFVIISDALRYEVGKELQDKVQENIFGDCELKTMLGVVPSVTKLGMAALLPHRTLTIDDNSRPLVNGNSTSGLKGRRKILEAANEVSVAINHDELVAMNIAAQRELFKGKKLIYIYHDTIDAMGDEASTEINTFDAVTDGIDQLSNLVRSLTNNISATNIYITADHGFLYEREKLDASDFIRKEHLNETIDMSRRYILSHEKKDISGQLTINLTGIIDNEKPLYAYVPNATIRYRVQGGGANFVHGGASLQEIVIPLLAIKNKRRGQSGARITEKVDVALTSTMRRITNSIFSLDFFQKERISDEGIARSLSIYFEDNDMQMISNEEKLIIDSESTDPRERMYKLQFILKNQLYDPNKTYYLVLKDRETDHIVERIPFTINLGITSDFDF